jgi:hypothetical protein
MTRWSQALLLLFLSATLIAAPCAHCTIQPATQTQHDPAHDCCPKQKQDQETGGCGWMPAQYVAPEGLTPAVELAVALAAPVVPPVEPAIVLHETPSFDDPPPPASPPLFLTNASFLI